ncbi:MAG: cysteine synthase A, partial [Thermoguttaceae bacterium]|nr:cysteine synthase A [Thermoguttaceae bacterium]
MTAIAKSAADLIGNTPLLDCSRLCASENLPCRLLAKLEFLNPAGSAKDRVAKSMIEAAEKDGSLKPGGTIIEPTSGNTGIALAAVAASRGYRVIIAMPETMSVERQKLIKGYGAELVLTDGSQGMKGAIDKALELAKTIDGAFVPLQFDNPANPAAHRETTGPEIWRDTGGNVDIYVASAGTGGTLSGTAQYLKKMNPDIRVAAVEPAASNLLSGGKAGPHKIQGIGANFIPKVLDTTIYDEVVDVPDAEAFVWARKLAKTEGILCGISSGAVLWAVSQIAKKPENKGKTIVAVLTDNGERYL